jgi:hypothetical protein
VFFQLPGFHEATDFEWDFSLQGARYQATHPKDHIYGLLGLIRLSLKPEYNESRPFEEVYADYFAKWVESNQIYLGLRMLTMDALPIDMRISQHKLGSRKDLQLLQFAAFALIPLLLRGRLTFHEQVGSQLAFEFYTAYQSVCNILSQRWCVRSARRELLDQLPQSFCASSPSRQGP